MTELTKLLEYYGPLLVIAGVFLWTYLADRRITAAERKAFIELTTDFKNTVDNHLDHETEALRDLTKAIERLCIYMEGPNRDYHTTTKP